MKNKFYQNFELAFNRLEAFVNQGVIDDLDRAGIIQAFEFTFEQAWKAVQKKAVEEGVPINSPKQALKWGLKQKWISPDNEASWLNMLEDRNLTSHTYREEIAHKISSKVEKTYLTLFQSLLQQMKKNL
jgi:nucleotidyltransferase substrate binding protein (TIGR01987 family)